ncbi:conserved hypothetical protein [Microsporum canis CBS 113480]|uniref:Uncharacterized protein n=1 Tax=Arthroderma otae (strain ATCC MYA-4605 / CBS 113480) TaxID=554155 RepID=C5FYZ6_ARTOC|nr:conserved hypothetical protein [Microsporum canis CBS 113480]EEQ34744.1 conserved hypothetical protein [Microsporum canis CBS 113480]
MSPPPEPCILLYAELLANIRPLRLFVTATNTTQNDHPGTGPLLSLSTSLSAVTVSHIGKTLTLELPRSVSARSREFLAAGRPVSCSGENEYSFRLPIDEANPFLSATSSNDCGPEAPWPAKSMTTRTCICCRECSGILFAPSDGQAVVWKDLPGADWAELMDLWHCHKPNPIPNNNTSEDHPDLSGHTKGYGAANRVICEPGTIFVNVTSFIMAANDSQGVKRVFSIHQGATAIDDPKNFIYNPYSGGTKGF